MVDLASLAGRTAGMLLRPVPTVADHIRPLPPWTLVAREHAAPLLIASTIVWATLTWAFRDFFVANAVPIPDSISAMMVVALLRLAVQFAGLMVMAKIAALVAGNLGGRDDFTAAYTLTALSLTPSMLCNALSPIPLVGGVIWLTGFGYGVSIFYRAATIALDVPAENRGKHLALTLVVTFIAMLMLMAFTMPILAPFLGPLSAKGTLVR